jgi:C4-dicarboxylate transporter, DctM subunit
VTLTLIGLAALFLLFAVGVPLAYAMGLVGFVGFTYVVSFDAAVYSAGQIVFDNVLNFEFSVVPLFIVMGSFVSRSGLADDLFASAEAFLGHFRGGLAMATIAACGAFSAVCGSSMATAATMVKVSLPAMRRRGYADSLATGSIAAGGTLGNLIPPSTMLVIYGVLTETDLGQLIVASVIPGTIAMLLLMLTVSVTVYFAPGIAPRGGRSGWKDRLFSLRKTGGVIGLFILMMGGVYFGVFTVTEAAGIGAVGALLFVILRGASSWSFLGVALTDAARTTAVTFVILFGALMFINFIEVTGLPNDLGAWINHTNLTPLALILLITVIYLVLGTIMDSLSMILLTVPLFLPIINTIGYDPVWFGIYVLIVAEIGQISPPVGLNIFVVRAMARDVPLNVLFKGLYAFVVAEIVLLGIIIFWPDTVWVLPELMD